MPPIPVTLLTGFLGAGKTTLLNRLLAREAGVAVVVNEIGQVGVDQLLLAQSGSNVSLLAGGCLCCTLQGSLGPTLKNLWLGRQDGSVPPFTRVVIETTGLADPAAMLGPLLADRWLAQRYQLQLVVTLVDGQLGDEQLKRIPLTVRQVCAAQRLLIGKVDLAEGVRLRALREVLERLAPGVEQQLLSGDDDDGQWLVTPATTSPAEPASAPLLWLPASQQQLATFTLQPPAIAPDSSSLRLWLEQLLTALGERLLRLKGLVAVADAPSPLLVQAVQQWLLEYRPSTNASAGPLVLIGDGISSAELQPLLAAGGWTLADQQQLEIRR
ncbi:MAG: GTP-binding protein [Corallincola sp.]|nr:GTP-binding protein [Corallincola sp.]